MTTSPDRFLAAAPGYWTKERTINDAKAFIAEYGAEQFTKARLNINGCRGLAAAITKHGGFAWVRTELGLASAATPVVTDPAQAESLLNLIQDDCVRPSTAEIEGHIKALLPVTGVEGGDLVYLAAEAGELLDQCKAQYGNEFLHLLRRLHNTVQRDTADLFGFAS